MWRSSQRRAKTVRFDYEQLTAGQARPCGFDGSVGAELISYGSPKAHRLCESVNPETVVEAPPKVVSEIWAHGDHVTIGYWRSRSRPRRSSTPSTVDPAPAPQGPWPHTGDLGVISDE